MNILVTGGAGFIGSALCRHLVSVGENVVNVDGLEESLHRWGQSDTPGRTRRPAPRNLENVWPASRK